MKTSVLHVKNCIMLLVTFNFLLVSFGNAQLKATSEVIQLMQKEYNTIKNPEISFKNFAQINKQFYEKKLATLKAKKSGNLAQTDTYCNNVKPYCSSGDFEAGLDQSQYTGAYGTWFGGIYPDPFALTYGFSSG